MHHPIFTFPKQTTNIFFKYIRKKTTKMFLQEQTEIRFLRVHQWGLASNWPWALRGAPSKLNMNSARAPSPDVQTPSLPDPGSSGLNMAPRTQSKTTSSAPGVPSGLTSAPNYSAPAFSLGGSTRRLTHQRCAFNCS